MMNLTLVNIIILAIVFGLSISITLYLTWNSFDNRKRNMTIGIVVNLVALLGAIIFLNWYNTSTASGIRHYKDFESNMTNGIERDITITAEDGREIFHYEGKVDIESNHEDNYIKFESEDGKRYMIYYGIQDTIQIIEK